MDYAGTLKLRKPFKVDGTMVDALSYDFDALTVADILEADRNRREYDSSVNLAPVQLDAATQLNVFALAVGKVMGNVTREDIMRMSGKDGLAAMTLARRFFLESGEEDEDEAETTPEEPEDSEPVEPGEATGNVQELKPKGGRGKQN